MCHGSFNGVSRKIEEYLERAGVSREFQGDVKEVQTGFEGSFNNVSLMFQGCCQKVSVLRMIEEFFEGA